jgi:hypothetical protein
MASSYIPQVDYTSRDYAAIRDNMIALIPTLLPEWTSTDPSDFGITLIELFSYMGDMLSYYIDRSANEGFIQTATQRSSVLSIAQLLGYTPSTATPATVTLTFTNSTGQDLTVPAGTQVATTTSVNGVNTQIIFETDSDVLVPTASPSTANVQATQGETIAFEDLGVSDGTANQVKTLAKSPVISRTSQIVVGTLIGNTISGVTYTEVPYIIDAGYNDPVYSLTTDADDISYVNFGDGISGRIPPTNHIYATYRIGGGALGNVGPQTLTYQITNTVAGLRVTNNSSATGGSDKETTDSIRVNAPLAYTALTRAVSLADYAALAVQVPTVAKAIADSGSSYNSIIMYLAPFGDTSLGTPGLDAYNSPDAIFESATSDTLSYLKDKAPATTTVTVYPPSYVPVNVTLNAYINPHYKQSVVTTAINLALYNAFDFNNVVFSQNVVLQYLYNILSKIDGVDHTEITLLTRADALFTGGITSGSATITSPSSSNNVAVGQKVALTVGSGGTVTIPSGTTISAINTSTATITGASVADSIVTFTASNSFTAGQPVKITGVNPEPFNIAGVVLAATGSRFTVSAPLVNGAYVSGGTATAVVSYTMSANAGGSGSFSNASIWTSSLATTGVNSIQCAVNELPKAGAFTVIPSGGIIG